MSLGAHLDLLLLSLTVQEATFIAIIFHGTGPLSINYQLCELPQNPTTDLMIPVGSHGGPTLHMPRSKANQSTDILGSAGGSMLAAPQLGSRDKYQEA